MAVSLPLMRRGVFNTTWKQNAGVFNGKQQKKNHLDRKKAQMPRMQLIMLCVSLIIRG